MLPESYLIKPEEMEAPARVRICGVRFKDGGKVYFFDPDGLEIKAGQSVIVETARGLEYGTAAYDNKEVSSVEIITPLKKVIRLATNEDAIHKKDNDAKEKEACRVCEEMIAQHGLEMKLVEVVLLHVGVARRLPRPREGPRIRFQNEDRATPDRYTRRGEDDRRTRRLRKACVLSHVP